MKDFIINTIKRSNTLKKSTLFDKRNNDITYTKAECFDIKENINPNIKTSYIDKDLNKKLILPIYECYGVYSFSVKALDLYYTGFIEIDNKKISSYKFVEDSLYSRFKGLRSYHKEELETILNHISLYGKLPAICNDIHKYPNLKESYYNRVHEKIEVNRVMFESAIEDYMDHRKSPSYGKKDPLKYV